MPRFIDVDSFAGGGADPLGCGTLRCQRVLGSQMGCALACDGSVAPDKVAQHADGE